MANRFYCPGPWVDGVALLRDEEARHLATSSRVGVGDSVEVFDGRGRSGVTTVVEVGRNLVRLRVESERDDPRRLAGPLLLATAVPKGDRFDWLVEKATELGVTRLVPLVTARSVVDPRASKLDRLRRLVIEASKQSGRSTLMSIDGPTGFADWLSDRSVSTRYLAHPTGPRVAGLPRLSMAAGIGLTVGPEGGFTDPEVAEAEAAGWTLLGLGPTILRVETAALAATVAVLTMAEDDGREEHE